MTVTPSERRVLDLLLQGCEDKDMAQVMHCSLKTVKNHLGRLYVRYGIKEGCKRVKLATAVFRELSGIE